MELSPSALEAIIPFTIREAIALLPGKQYSVGSAQTKPCPSEAARELRTAQPYGVRKTLEDH